MKKITDVTKGLEVHVEPRTGSISTYHLPKSHIAILASPPTPDCGVAADAAKKTVLGYETVRFYQKTEMPDAVEHIESWLAPKLDCYALIDRSDFGPPGGPEAVTTQVVQSVTEGEPSGYLFEVPQSFQERPPSQVSALFEKLFPGHPFHLNGAVRQDRRYYAMQPGSGHSK
jgi:hypothetical protein